jgi:superfamily I DNA/RNA helicase
MEDRLVWITHHLFIDYPKIAALYRRSFSAICVDEAQDMNNAQYQLLKVLANGVNHILMVGDPNQSIFHFNGSSFLCRLQYLTGRAVVFIQLNSTWIKVFDEHLIHIIGR